MANKAILCVDDEKIILNSLKSQLRKNFGPAYMYEMAENAEEAMEVIEKLVAGGVEILIIVSDWLMPGIKGDEFLIQVHKRFPRIVKVMLTGQANEEAVRRATDEADLFAHISKPWNEDDLVNVIRTGLERL
ncbi:MAG: response regulator [Nitrospinae bacterium]|nr:response regulator [Nitrospinota bacterium]